MPAAAALKVGVAVIKRNRLFILDKGNRAARRGRKAMGPLGVARLPKG
jgi:hypothetical protein